MLTIGAVALLFMAGIMGAQNATERAPEERAAELVSHMTLEEKVGQIQDKAPAIPHLGIPAYNWWNEALHGVARAGLATVFPQAIGLAATWDTDLEHRIADIISTEARAKYNDAIAHNDHSRYRGLTFWSPNINIFRDPRWGRGQETYGEDPYLTGRMAVEFIRGMQGDDPRYLKTVATSKHFAVHSGPEVSRHTFDVHPSEEDLASTYLPAFRTTVVDAAVQSVMCAYNSVNGAPACANTMLLQENLREKWGFKGYVVSDCGAVGDIYQGHHYAASMAQAAADAVKAGTDLDCGSEYKALTEAVQRRYITEAAITRSVERLFAARFRLGLFDPPDQVPFSKIGMDQVASEAHHAVALEAAEKSIVLLKNADHILPLETVPKRIAVIGPAADDPDAMLGNYNGIPRQIVTPLEGIKHKFGSNSEIQFALGSVYAETSMTLVPSAVLSPPEKSNSEHGVQVEYFANARLEGTPVLVRTEPRGYFIWAMHDPDVMRVLPQPTFSLRWRALMNVQTTGDYDLGVGRQECDTCPGRNSTRLYLNGELLLNETHTSYAGNQTFRKHVHLEAGHKYEIKLEYSQTEGGSGVELLWAPPPAVLLDEARAAAKNADLAILCLGLNSRLEGEESPVSIPGFSHGDRTDIRLPQGQEILLESVLNTGKPVIVVLVNGSALAVKTAKQGARAILEAWYGGEAGGEAIANTLAGNNNPAGRLPVTFYASVDQLRPFDDYSMADRTYRYFKGEPLYPFGYGLSYSEFRYSEPAREDSGSAVNLSARITNASQRDGDEVAQLYLSGSGTVALRGFQRIHLRGGESRTVHFQIEKHELDGKTFFIGGGQPTHAPRS